MGRSSERPNDSTLRGILDDALAFNRRSRTEVRFTSFSSQPARPEFRSLTGVWEGLFLFLRSDARGIILGSCWPLREGVFRSCEMVSVWSGGVGMRRLRPAKASVGSVERLARVLASRKHQRRRCRWHLGRVLGASGPALARTVAWRDAHCGVRRSIGGWRIDEFLFLSKF